MIILQKRHAKSEIRKAGRMPLCAELTLECPNRHRFTMRWPLIEHAVAVPDHDDECCPECGLLGRLVMATRGE